jgi:putative transposase
MPSAGTAEVNRLLPIQIAGAETRSGRAPDRQNPGLDRAVPELRHPPHLGLFAVNRKKVARIMRLKGWTMRQRKTGLRPRVEISRSQAERPDQRWGTDIALVFCGAEDGWCSFVPVLDCCTREAMGWELSLTARAKTAERALESALIKGFGFVHGAAPGMKLRSDNGLVFGSKLYRRLCREYNLSQEFITPYTPEENGLVERFIRSFKEECVWLHNFESMAEARTEIAKWIDWYNNDRPHQALNYKTPDQARKEFNKLAA